MDFPLLQALLDWIAANPLWAGLFVFLIALSESLAVVGLLVPGAVLLFGIGALIATGTMAFWPTLAWAVAGAIAGDAISFWLGRYYKQRLHGIWPFRTHPGLLARGVDFFHRHGGKSVVFGRFVGPLRPVIPAVAGMMHMPVRRFLLVNVLSALAWAPLYLLPGMAFGASLEIAAEVAARLAVFLLTILVVLWLTAWAVRRAYAYFMPRAAMYLYRALEWSRVHPRLGRLVGALVDPERPEVRGLAVLALILIGAALSFIWLSQAVGGSALMASINSFVFHNLQELRTPWADRLMVLVTLLGDWQFLSAVALVLLAWFALQRHWYAAAHWVAAAAVPTALTQLIKLTAQIPRPQPVETLASFAFPSAHASMSMAVYGFLAVMLAREFPLRAHVLIYLLAGLVIASIGFSRVYLGVHWLSDVLGGFTLGLAWVALLGIAYRRHRARPLPRRRFALAALAAIVAVGTLYAGVRLDERLAAYQPQRAVQALDAQRWWQEGWAMLPSHRRDLRGEQQHPLNLQWAGGLQDIERRLHLQGWQPPPALSPLGMLQWLRAAPDLGALPVLPQVHDGQHESLVLVRRADEKLLVVRLWAADTVLTDNGRTVPLWIGNVSYLDVTHPLGLSFLRTAPDFDAPLARFRAQFPREDWTLRRYPAALTGPPWQGQVLLRRED